tara:strand:- start:931 stop:1113 length:183 start_codon:yes stop_codon:yes gene_type:complete
MTKKTWTRGHIHETILDNVLSDQYLTAMCVEDYISSMSEEELDKWCQTFIKTGSVKKEVA